MQRVRCLLLLTLTCFLLASAPSAQTDTAQEVLSRIPEPLTRGRPVAMQIETEAFVHIPEKDGSVDSRHIRATTSYVRDRERVHSMHSAKLLDERGQEIPEHSATRIQLVTDEFVVDAEKYDVVDRYMGSVGEDADEVRGRVSVGPNAGGILSGLALKDVFVPELLAESPELRPDMEEIDGVPCYVLESSTEQGEVTAWVAPGKGWNFLKYIVHRTGEHTVRGKTLKEGGAEEWTLAVDNVRIEKIGDEDVPVSGDSRRTTTFTDGRVSEFRFSIKRTSIDLTPDFEAMDAFRLDFPDGTVLRHHDVGLRYEVKNGALVPYADISEVAALTEGLTQLQTKVAPEPATSTQAEATVSETPSEPPPRYYYLVGVFCAVVLAVLACALLLPRVLRRSRG